MIRTKQLRGFTIIELLTVIAIIGILIAITVPAVTGAWKVSARAESMSRMKQISTWMTLYGNDNRDSILPSQFDYSDADNPGEVCSNPALGDTVNKGTWADILWAENDLYSKVMSAGGIVDPNADPNADPDDPEPFRARTYYRYKAPDGAVYDSNQNYDASPLRSAVRNSFNFPRPVGSDSPTPYGNGASEQGLAGFFAANDHFNQRIGENYSYGQIKQPSISMYLVDSMAGETIGPEVGAHPWAIPLSEKEPPIRPTDDEAYWDSFRDAYDFGQASSVGGGTGASAGAVNDQSPGQVDFRYGDQCLMLFLDGHMESVGRWSTLEGLETGDMDGKRIRVTGLTDKHSPICEDEDHDH